MLSPHHLAGGIGRTERLVGIAADALIPSGEETERRGQVAERIVEEREPRLGPRMEQKPPGHRHKPAPLGDDLDEARVRAEDRVCPLQVEAVPESPDGTHRIVVMIPGDAQSGKHQPRIRVLGADGIIFPLQPEVCRPQLPLAEAPVSAQFQEGQPGHVGGGILLLDVYQHRRGTPDFRSVRHDIPGRQPLETFGYIEIRRKFMAALQDVEVAVPDIDPAARIRSVPDSLAEGFAGRGFHLDEDRHLGCMGFRFFGRDGDLPETFGVREVDLRLAELGVRKGLPGLERQIPSRNQSG